MPNKKNSVRSFILWSVKNDDIVQDSSNNNIDIHINLWNSKNRKKHCFDFGLMIKDVTDLKSINLFVPFNIKTENLHDLGETITKYQSTLISALFNESCKVRQNIAPQCTEVCVGKDRNNKFIIYNLSRSQEEITLKTHDNGSLISINCKRLNNNRNNHEDIKSINRYYFRFRFIYDKEHSVITTKTSEASAFQGFFTGVDILDFRLNDIRSCPSDIYGEYTGNSFKMEKIHLLIMRPVKDEVIYHGGEMNSRILEDEIWHNYFLQNKCEINKEDMIAYHIKGKNETSFNALVRFRFGHFSFKTFVLLLCFPLFISLLANIISKIFDNYSSFQFEQIRYNTYSIIILVLIILFYYLILEQIPYFWRIIKKQIHHILRKIHDWIKDKNRYA